MGRCRAFRCPSVIDSARGVLSSRDPLTVSHHGDRCTALVVSCCPVGSECARRGMQAVCRDLGP